jgi:hypothetical protein
MLGSGLTERGFLMGRRMYAAEQIINNVRETGYSE